MPIARFEMPDGRIARFEVPEGTSPEQAQQLIANQVAAPGFGTPDFGKKTGLLAAVGKGTEGVISSSKTALGSIFGDATEAGKQSLERGAKSEYADQVGTEKVKEAYNKNGLLSAIGEVGRQVPLAIAEQAPNIGASLASARLGAMAGSAVGSIVPGVGTGIGAVVGGGLGMFAPSLLQQMGGNVERQVKETGSASAGKAAAAAVPQALLDVASTYIPMGKTIIGKVLGPEVTALFNKGSKEAAEKLAKESILKAAAKGTAVGAVAEIPAEVVQSALERLQAGLPVLSEDAFKEYGETAYQASLLAPIGGAGRVVDRSAARGTIAPSEVTPEAESPVNRAIAAAQAAEAEAAEAAAQAAAGAPTGRKKGRKGKATAATPEATVEDQLAEAAQEPTAPVAEETPVIPEPTVRKKGASNVPEPAVVEPGEAAPIEPSGTAAVVPSVGVDSGIDAVTAAAQPEGTGVGVSELPTTDGNAPESITAPTVTIDGRPFTVTDQTDTAYVLSGGKGTTKVVRNSDLGRAIKAQLSTEPAAIEAPAVAEVPAEAPAAEVPTPAAPAALEGLTTARDRLLTPSGKVPAPRSKARKEYDALQSQIDDLTPAPERNPYEPPLAEGLTPQKEKALRIRYAAEQKEAATLEKELDVLRDKLFQGQDFYTDGQKQAIQSEIDRLSKPYSKATSSMEKTYYELYDKDKAELQAETGEAYVSDENARREEAARVAKLSNEGRKSYPYNLTSIGAVHEELRDQMSHMPEYKAYIEKYFTLDRNRLKNKVSEAEAIAEGQKLIDKSVLYNVQALNAAVPTSKEFSEAVGKGQTRKALQIVLNHPQSDPITKLVIRSILKAGTLPKLSVVPKNSLGVDPETGDVRAGQYDAVSDSVTLDTEFVNAANLIHEVIHGFLHRKVTDYVQGEYKDAQVKRIDDLYQFLKSNQPELAKSYGMTNLSEFVSEVMSNGSLQEKLRDIPYKKSNAFRDFAKAVLKLLGINDTTPKWNALAEALISTETVMQSGRALQEVRTGTAMKGPSTPSVIATPSAVAVVAQADVIGDTVQRSKLDDFRKAFGKVNRINLVDRLSSMEEKLMAGYMGKLRDIMGNINPKELLAQALDAPRLVERAIVEGYLTLTKDGMFVASKGELANGEEASGKRIMKIVGDSAKQNGKSFAEQNKFLSGLIVGHREFNLNAQNKSPTSQVVIELRIKDPVIRNKLEQEYQANADAKKISEIMDAMRFNRIDMMVYAGRISQDKADFWKSTLGYVPYQDLEVLNEKITEFKTGAGKGLSKTSKYLHIRGDDTQVGNVIDSFVDLMSRMTLDAINVNAVNRSAAAMELLGHAKKISPVARVSRADEAHVVDTFVNGKPTRYFFNDPLDAAAYGAIPSSASSLVQAAQGVARILRANVVLQIGFAVGQVLTDLTRAYALSDVSNPAALIPRILMNFATASFGELTGRKRDVVIKLENMGVAATFDVSTQGTVKNIMEQVGAQKRGVVGSILHVVEAFSKASDIAVRQSIYEQSMIETKDEALSVSRAREIINFSRRGVNNTVDTIVRTVPFTNAYIRGTDKLYTAATGKTGAYGMTQAEARSMFRNRIANLAGVAALYTLMMMGDDEYESLDDHVRDSRIIIPGVKIDGALVSVPLPKDLAFIFKAIPERTLNYVRKYGTEEEQNGMFVIGELLRQGLLTIAAPNVIPSALLPVVENLFNYSTFLDRPLESQSQQDRAAFTAYGRGTSGVTKEISEGMAILAKQFSDMGLGSVGAMFKVSPIKIENLLRGWFGTSAALALSMGDMLLDPDKTAKSPHKGVLAQLTGASAIMTDPVGRKQLNEFYDVYDQVSEYKKTLAFLESTDPLKADKYAKEHIPEMEVVGYADILYKEIQKLNKTISMIDKETKFLTPDEKLKAISGILKEQNEMAKEARYIKRHLLKR